MLRILTLLLLTLCLTSLCSAQPKVDVLTKGTKTSIRGLSVVDDNIAWVSGSGGTIGRTTDGGKTWKWSVVKGFEKRDFRDIEAFSITKAVIIAVDSPAYILKTIDGGETWKVVYESNRQGMFLDALEFWNEQAGIVVGDPIGGRLFVARTFDEGDSWQEVPAQGRPEVDSGEAMFASSGTNVRVLDRDEAVLITGGRSSRVFIRDQAIRLPITQGLESTGANSIAVQDVNTRKGGKNFVVVGGDFTKAASDSLNCFYTTNRGKTWKAPETAPHGYRSCVEYLSKRDLVTCGLNGVDYSSDGGRNWTWISKEGFHVCRKAKKGTAVYFAGGGGKIGKLVPAKKD
ncbi:oxidoreductase [Flaviaesturariibacter flavus]|uniref:Oxidoreductase n=1 Tax=Flaviaesturariibacter flavus TaxID=2502780 RepID=A0A4R1BNF4_9BACT|nr:sialidase family protein [Flaviaesturariibacter flavus]TCJ19140.1 oxidoreductase [Flaviaesturariibacter flavus]